MRLYSLKIANKVFRTAVVSDEADMRKGLSGKPKLGKNKGLLFNFKEAQPITMNMGGMLHPIDMIFICENMKVIKVAEMKIDSKDISVDKALYVLEVAKGAGKGLDGKKVQFTKDLAQELGLSFSKSKAEQSNNIIVKVSKIPEKFKEKFKMGGAFRIYEDEVSIANNAMQVLDDTGKVLMNIVGGERIFSIKHTEQLVKLSKLIDRGEAEEEELGLLMTLIIGLQDTQEPEYV